jgi:hypothetical protein
MADQRIPADMTALLRALEFSAYIDRSLSVDDIALVEAAWQIADTLVSSYGWVLAMNDHSRLYVEYTLDDIAPGLPEELEALELRPHETYPTLESDAGVVWYRPDHINEYFGITPPSLH